MEELALWAETYGITHPVVADPNFYTTARYVDGGSIVMPSMTLLGAGATVISRDTPVSEADVVANLP